MTPNPKTPALPTKENGEIDLEKIQFHPITNQIFIPVGEYRAPVSISSRNFGTQIAAHEYERGRREERERVRDWKQGQPELMQSAGMRWQIENAIKNPKD